MAEPKQYFERHSLAVGLQTYLVSGGWTDITKVEEGFQTGTEVYVPMVSVYFRPSNGKEPEMGRSSLSWTRQIQIDCYMESEKRAMAIVDDIVDYLDLETITITKPDASVLGIMFVPDSEAMITNTLPPLYTDPSIKRWRGIVQAPLEVHYY